MLQVIRINLIEFLEYKSNYEIWLWKECLSIRIFQFIGLVQEKGKVIVFINNFMKWLQMHFNYISTPSCKKKFVIVKVSFITLCFYIIFQLNVKFNFIPFDKIFIFSSKLWYLKNYFHFEIFRELNSVSL